MGLGWAQVNLNHKLYSYGNIYIKNFVNVQISSQRIAFGWTHEDRWKFRDVPAEKIRLYLVILKERGILYER
jgi:hypothetical protein